MNLDSSISSRGGDHDKSSEWGYIRFEAHCLPFVRKYGKPMFPFQIINASVFGSCKCSISRTIMNRILKAQGVISSSWDEIQLIEKEEIVRKSGVRNGGKLLKVIGNFRDSKAI